MGVDQVSRHDHSTDADGGESISPTSVETGALYTASGESTAQIYLDGTTVVADGADGEIARGTDTAAVVQAVVNETAGGRLFVRGGTFDGIDATIGGLGAGTTLAGENRNQSVLKSDGAFGGFLLENAPSANYVTLENLQLNGGGSADGLHLSHADAGGNPLHADGNWLNVVNCGVGVHIDGGEDCVLSGGRYGGNDVGVRWEAPGGWGLMQEGLHMVDYSSVGLKLDVEQMELDGVVFGSGSGATAHIQLLDDTERVTIRGSWFESAPPVLDLNGFQLDTLAIEGNCTFNLEGGNAVIADLAGGGAIGQVRVAGGARVGRTNDAGTVEFLGLQPDSYTGARPDFDADSTFGNKGFRRFIAPGPSGGSATEIGGDTTLTVDGQQSEYHWELLDSHVDEDRDSTLDVSFTGLNDMRFLMITGVWLTRESPRLRVNQLDNANDNANYQEYKTNGSSSSSNGSFSISGANNTSMHGQLVFVNPKSSWDGNRVSVSARIGTGEVSLTSGMIRDPSISAVDRLDMFAADDGNGNQRGGFVGELYGRNGTLQ
jgi:hypothetical protein